MVLSSQNLYAITDAGAKKSFYTPFVIFSLLAVFIVLLRFTKIKLAQAFLQGFDGLFFFLTGVLGIILIFMWVGTDHSMTKNNFNLLWAWPTHAIMAFLVKSNKSWVKTYFIINAVVLTALLICWYFLPQKMNDGLIPVILLLIYLSIKKSFATNMV